MTDTIYILGKGDGWREIENAPKGSIIYGTNDAFLRTPEVTHSFHMHDLKAFLEKPDTHSSTKLCIEHAKLKPEMEFYTIKPFPEIKQAKLYPLDEIIDHFKVCYFTSTIEYMIAFALWKGVKNLKLYGCNMSVKQEYIEQKPGMEYWVGRAVGMGVNVELQHQYTSLLKTKNSLLYGYLINQWRVDS
jgi:hypothetical protein